MEQLTKILTLLTAAVVLTVVLAWPVQLLWNSSLAPAVNSINPITFWQALGINLLTTILFKSSQIKTND